MSTKVNLAPSGIATELTESHVVPLIVNTLLNRSVQRARHCGYAGADHGPRESPVVLLDLSMSQAISWMT